MSISVLQRTIALAAVALVAAVGAVALASDGGGGSAAEAGPRAVPAPGGGWYTALAGSRGPTVDGGERTTCRLIVRGRSLGVTHPSLPCGAKLYVEYDGTELLTEVIDNRLKQPGRQFELTDLLAQRLGLDGTQEIRWRFAALDR